MSNKLDQRIFKKIRDANKKYELIATGDKVAVGMSGGKDSMALLHYIMMLQEYTPLSFQVQPVYIDLGWGNDISVLTAFCKHAGVNLFMEKTNIRDIINDQEQMQSPCSLCANLRRGALNRTAKKLGCNKVALGHHLNDVTSTWLMSIAFEGRFRVFKPKTYLNRIDIEVIRPLIYVSEKEISSFMAARALQPVQNLCPVEGKTQRAFIGHVLQELESKIPNINVKIMSALEKIDNQSFWL